MYIKEAEIIEMLKMIQPHYDKLNSKYSKSYLQGSIWYIGDNLLYWYERCDKIYNYRNNINKILVIVEIIMNDMKYELESIKNKIEL